MPRIKEFIKNNYIFCTVFLVVFIVCISSLLIIHLINTFRPHIDVTNTSGAYYQVVAKDKYYFDASLRKENEVTKEITAKDYKLVSISPIYYKEESKLILNDNSVIVLYFKGFKDYQLTKYSEVDYEEDSKHVKIDGKTYLIDDFFIYDQNGNYIVMDEVTLKYNGKTVKLSPLSFINASASGLTYYDYQKDEIVDVNEDIKSAFLVYETFNIDAIKNVVIKNGKVTILKNDATSLAVYKED